MLIIDDSSKRVPDIPATVLNLRQHFDAVRVVWGKPVWITQELERIQADTEFLEALSISRENLLLVQFVVESLLAGSIQFQAVEVFVAEPKWGLQDRSEFSHTLRLCVVYGCSR